MGVPAVLGLVWLGGWWLFGLAAGAAALALHEYAGMTRPLRPLVPAAYIGGMLALLGAQLGGVDWTLAGFLVSVPLALFLKGIADTRQAATIAIGATVLGAAWIGLGLAHVILLRDIPEHAQLAAFTVLLAVWGGDTAAYLVGMLIGRHKLTPVLSPGKTWEGFVAGTVATILITFFALYDDRENFLNVWQAIVLGVVLAVSAPAGDLFESALKRDMHVKDSGRLLAGHGGMLDRIDALLFGAVAAFYLIAAFGWA